MQPETTRACLVAGAALVLLASGLGCDREGSTSETSRKPESAKVSGMVSLAEDIPAGLEVRVDGKVVGRTPMAAWSPAPGKHQVSLQTPCGEAEATLEAGTTEVSLHAKDFRTLDTAMLHVTVVNRDNAALEASIKLGDWEVAGGAKDPTLVPACLLRMKVSSGELGAFIEDINFASNAVVERKITLLPGTDLVRIHGGPFKLGPPGPDRYDPDFEGVGPGEDFEGWPWIQQHDTVVETFDIDRHEVTNAQFEACRKDGPCEMARDLWTGVRKPPREERRYCTTELTLERPLKDGYEEYPKNCVSYLETKMYCAWVGKRLPTENEWEYAARGGEERFECPWGPLPKGESNCDRAPYLDSLSLRKVCSFSNDDSRQGVCDLGNGVSEYVLFSSVVHSHESENCESGIAYRSRFHAPIFEPGPCTGLQWNVRIGFRCARTVEGDIG